MSVSRIINYFCYQLKSGPCLLSAICIVSIIKTFTITQLIYLIYLLYNTERNARKRANAWHKLHMKGLRTFLVYTLRYLGSFTYYKHFPHQRVIVTMDNATCHPPTLNDIDDLIDIQANGRHILLNYIVLISHSFPNDSIQVVKAYIRFIYNRSIFLSATIIIVTCYELRHDKTFSYIIQRLSQLVMQLTESNISATVANSSRYYQIPTFLNLLNKVVCKLKIPYMGGNFICPQLACFGLNYSRGFYKQYAMSFLLQMRLSLPKLASIAVKRPNILVWPFKNNNGTIVILFAPFKENGDCMCRRWQLAVVFDPSHLGSVVGVNVTSNTISSSMTSIHLYLNLKSLMCEALYVRGMENGYLPCIPYSVELLYSISTGYLFHMAAVEKHNLKPSYWRFLQRLTWGRMGQYNRQLLDPWGLDSARHFMNFWPDYNMHHISPLLREIILTGELPG
ncbi:unnamed protein product, partial [Meganyctiphanes norvegica]